LCQDDLGEFGACQAALVPLHAARRSAHAAEFGAYRLLHAAALRGDGLAAELHPILSSLRQHCGAEAEPAVRRALAFAMALAEDDLLVALRLLPTLHHQGTALLRARLPRLRERALHVLCRAFAPTLPLSVIARRLGFGADARACEQWLRSLGTVPAASSGKPELELDTRASLRTLNEREAEAARARAADEAARQRTAPTRDREVGPGLPFDMLAADWGGSSW